ncbi:hypothetical protein CDL12_00712 [Olea europaea subsp. europaea]|uniref:Uncharacterized protein n=1 Tax=Olea europaea subsp. europaea TaxID=158383 RepID=A0A8S0QLY5_OLEEU|nr:hypothetical protein CDL12_00712 [Olea europaea subsp. europaea]
MIYRKWSLLTGPAAILAGIVGTVVVVDLLFIENDRFHKTQPRKQETTPSTK